MNEAEHIILYIPLYLIRLGYIIILVYSTHMDTDRLCSLSIVTVDYDCTDVFPFELGS